MPQRTIHDTVLLSGWLFADLFLGLTIIFLAALPGAQPIAEIQTLDANVTTVEFDKPAMYRCNSPMFQCTITLKKRR